jgi:hypothetical protein
MTKDNGLRCINRGVGHVTPLRAVSLKPSFPRDELHESLTLPP